MFFDLNSLCFETMDEKSLHVKMVFGQYWRRQSDNLCEGESQNMLKKLGMSLF